MYILATGDVVITGIIDVSGESTTNTTLTSPGKGGPGGYDGGYGGASGLPGGKGLGPGAGGGGPSASYRYAGGGGYGSPGGSVGANYGAGGPAYGNARLVPLIGGSGGGGMSGSTTTSGYGGGGGGGAILIASSTSITVTGSITANGGNGYSIAGGGSGGAIRLMANTISGNGTISAKGGSLSAAYHGGQGFIRLEAYTNNRSAGTEPPYSYGQPGSVFVANIPSLSITSVAGVSVPASPTGSYAQPDMFLPGTTVNPVTVTLSAANIPVGTTVTVSVVPQYGAAADTTAALSGSDASSTASANVNLSTQYSNVIMAQTTFTLLASIQYENEKIKKVRVATRLGGASETIYITESGREIPAAELIAKLMK
ncbi:MAG TPA: hypothetical protein ENG86_07785 [Nitrospirae bacterium]|nr:hypothetical protein [Nitrospirota bacterium]